MKLYFRPGTGRPMRIAWLLEELGVEYETVALTNEEVASESHLARHPLGRVPVLELDDGRALFESAAIVLNVADLYPDSDLIGPLGSPLRAEVYEWSIFAMTELERTVLLASNRTTDVGDEFKARMHALFLAASAAVGRRLGDSEFLLGEHLSAADIMVGGVLAVANFVELLDGAPPNVIAYFRRLQSRAAYARAASRVQSSLDQ